MTDPAFREYVEAVQHVWEEMVDGQLVNEDLIE